MPSVRASFLCAVRAFVFYVRLPSGSCICVVRMCPRACFLYAFCPLVFSVLSVRVLYKEKATQAEISGHISATLSQIRGVDFNVADIRNFNFKS